MNGATIERATSRAYISSSNSRRRHRHHRYRQHKRAKCRFDGDVVFSLKLGRNWSEHTYKSSFLIVFVVVIIIHIVRSTCWFLQFLFFYFSNFFLHFIFFLRFELCIFHSILLLFLDCVCVLNCILFARYLKKIPLKRFRFDR